MMPSARRNITPVLSSYKYLGAFGCFVLSGICGPEHGYAAMSCIQQWCGDATFCQQHALHKCVDDVNNSKVAYVQVVNISRGASVSFRTGGKGPDGPYPQHCGQPGPSPSYVRESITTAWRRFESDADVYHKRPLCLSNGAFFDLQKPAADRAFLSFPLKYNGCVISYGSDPSHATKVGNLMGLYIFRNGADIIRRDGANTSNSNICTNLGAADSAIVGLNPYTVNANKSGLIGRTFIGVGAENQSTGRYDKVYILVGPQLTQDDASLLLLNAFSVPRDKIVMLDGSGSSKLECQKPGGSEQLMFTAGDNRSIPQTIAVSLGYLVKVSNIDDRATVFVNGEQVISLGYGGTISERDITDKLRLGTNTVRFVLENVSGGYTYNFELEGPRINFSEPCGQAGVSGCNNNEMRTGIVYDKTKSFTVP